MSRVGRPPNTVPTVEITAKVRADVVAQVDLLLTDPMRDKLKYGVRSRLIERLLSEWLEKAKQAMREGKDPLRA